MNSGPKLSEDMKEELMTTFRMLDEEQEGVLDAQKMALALKVHGLEATGDTMQQIKKMENIGVGEFLTLMGGLLSESAAWCKLEVQECFEVFDKEKTGVVTIPQVKRVINRIAERLTDAEIEQQYTQFDMNHDMVLDMSGFAKAAYDTKSFES